jgi:MFS transporter, DHA3 family, tetracycline resistance protein
MNPYLVYLVLEGTRGLGLGLIIVAPIYRIEAAGFGPLELVLAGTALEVAYFACEVPTGVVADSYSRRTSVIIGAFLMGGAWLLEGSVPSLWPIMTAQAFLGAGWTFFSGASEAWVAGELGDQRAPRAIVRGKQMWLGANVVGAVAGAALGTIDLAWPVLAGGASHLALGAFLVAAMPEHGFDRTSHETRRAALAHTFTGGVRAIRTTPILLTILIVAFLAGMASEGIDRLWEVHLWEDLSLPTLGGLSRLYWFAIIGGVATVLSLPALGVARRWVERESTRALPLTIAFLSAAIAGGTALFGFADGVLLAAVAYWGVRVARNVAEPTYTVWIVRNTRPEVRATVLSMEGQSHSIGEIVSGPPLGIIGRAVSVPIALLVSGLMQAATIPLLLGASRSRPPEADQDAAVPFDPLALEPPPELS